MLKQTYNIIDYPFAAMIDGPMPVPGGAVINGATGGATPNTALKQVDRVRSVFPETWLWSNSTVGFVEIGP